MYIPRRTLSLFACLALLLALGGTADAGTITFTGTLDPETHSNLTYWDQQHSVYTAAQTGPTDYERAFNIAVLTFDVAVAGTVTFHSLGYGLGGFDPVLSVFQGTGNGAGYLGDWYGPYPPDDFSFNLTLNAGTYTLAVSNFMNEPCAPGYCVGATGVFGDGFTNLVNYDPAGTLLYYVDVTTPAGEEPPPNPVPEPATGLTLLVGLAALVRKRFRP